MQALEKYGGTPAWSRRCSTESILSIQGRETDVARDTSDTEAGEDLEYEPVTESEDEAPVDCDDTDITDEEIIQTKVIEVSVVEDRDLVFADSEPTDSAESDSEIDFNDYYQCAQCNAHNDNPLFRYCDKCFRSRKHFFPPRPKRKLKRRHGTQDLSQDLPQPLSQDSGVDTCPSQDLDPGTSAKRARSNSPEAKTYRSKSDVSLSTNEAKSIDLGQSSQDVLDCDTVKDKSKKCRSKSSNRDSKANSFDSDDDFVGNSSQNVLDFGSVPDKSTKISGSKSSDKESKAVDSDDDSPRDISTIPDKSKPKSSDDNVAGQSSQNVLDFKTIQNKNRKRSRRSESADRETKRTKRDSDTDDESSVQMLVKTISDPSITIEDSVKLTKKVLANTLKEMVTKDSQVDSNMCFICVSEPKSGVFVHGRIAHICCCYKCAMKIWSTAKRCPICNRKVSNVLKAVIT